VVIMALRHALSTLAASLALAPLADAHEWDPAYFPGSLVGVSIEVEGRTAPLYPAPDGSDRWYLEAHAGSRYAVRLTNRTGGRAGIVLTVDGLNAISGQRDEGTGRMYVLDPWEEITVRGWRTSLSEVRRFTFVDERQSYAARSGKANRKMGWIEIAVYRERRPWVRRPWGDEGWVSRRAVPPAGGAEAEGPSGERAEAAPPMASAPPAAKAAPGGGAAPADRDAVGRFAPEARESYPGTGWGPRAHDPVVVVDFDPESAPADRVTLRYEYASALRALGIFPRPRWTRDRLRERDRAADGFAPPPRW
jgi:hypothetical protein